MGARTQGGYIHEGSFIEYYADINACTPAEKDDYFVDLVLKTWGISTQLASVSAQRIHDLEEIVFEKVRQRTHGADDEGKTVKKIFKHFDLDGFGTIEMLEFTKSLETLGCVFKTFEIEALFNKYDANANGKLDYEEFAAFFAKKGSGNNPNVNPVFGIGREAPNQVLEKVKSTLKSRGANGIRGLGIVFRRIDNSRDRKLDRSEFMWGLKENGHDLSPSEFERIFKYFDKNNDGKIQYDEFLRGLRGDLTQRRKDLIKLAFNKLDRTGDGVVTIDDLKDNFDVSFHPKFKSGQMSKQAILSEFLSQWDTIKKDGIVSAEEFEDYYKDVSASIDDDDYFELMIRNAWHLEGGKGQYENTTIKRELKKNADGSQQVVMSKGHEDFSYDKNAKRFYGAEI
jgi:Ca2+-binding EF-hand superfamily protein